MLHNYIGEYQKVKIVPLTEEDSEKYRVIRNDDMIRRWYQHKEIISSVSQKKWYRNYLSKQNDVMFSIYVAGDFVGGNSLYSISFDNNTAEYGRLAISREHAGHGYGYQATMAALDVARQIGLKNIYLDVYYDNISALKTYCKCGFSQVDIIADDTGKKMIRMSITV